MKNTVELNNDKVQNYIMSIISDCGDSIANEIICSFKGSNIFDLSGNKLYTIMNGRPILNEVVMKNSTKILLGYILRDYINKN